MNRFILVPVYNEDLRILESFLNNLSLISQRYEAKIVVIDDGSDFPVSVNVSEENILVLRHIINCGVGAAIRTGMEYVKSFDAEWVVTVDGDGQHSASDVGLVIDELLKRNVDVVSGSRFEKNAKCKMQNAKYWIPLSRKFFNYIGNIVTWGLSGIWLTDSQSGMKGFSKRALQKIVIESHGFEWCSEIIRECGWYGLSIREVPISVLYSRYSLSKGQSFSVGLEMVFRLVVRSLMR